MIFIYGRLNLESNSSVKAVGLVGLHDVVGGCAHLAHAVLTLSSAMSQSGRHRITLRQDLLDWGLDPTEKSPLVQILNPAHRRDISPYGRSTDIINDSNRSRSPRQSPQPEHSRSRSPQKFKPRSPGSHTSSPIGARDVRSPNNGNSSTMGGADTAGASVDGRSYSYLDQAFNLSAMLNDKENKAVRRRPADHYRESMGSSSVMSPRGGPSLPSNSGDDDGDDTATLESSAPSLSSMQMNVSTPAMPRGLRRKPSILKPERVSRSLYYVETLRAMKSVGWGRPLCESHSFTLFFSNFKRHDASIHLNSLLGNLLLHSRVHQRFHAPPSSLLDIDVRDILSGTVRHVASTETSLRFDAFEATGDSNGGGVGDENAHNQNNSSYQGRSGSQSLSQWQAPPRRGSLLDWEADAAVAKSPAPRRGTLVLEDAGLSGSGRAHEGSGMGEDAPSHYGSRSTTSGMSGTLIYSQRTTHQEVLIAIYSEHFMACLHTFGHHIFEIVLWWSCLMRCPFLNSHFYPYLISVQT